MISKELARARDYESGEHADIPADARAGYHFSPRVGWLNDPNGFSYYRGRYHLFYQYHPYDSHWGPMHWGHAVSSDLIRWEYLPCALAPDTVYDHSGCFSGSAVTMDDGRHLVMYTSCGSDADDPTGKGRWLQTQSIAIMDPDDADGEYVKYTDNPVVSENDLTEGADPYEFRDPYMWRKADGSYRVLVASGRVSSDEGTQILMYSSDDGISWGDCRVFFEDDRRIGVMWECPSFFLLDGRYILMASPMDMQAEEGEAVGSVRFPQGNNVCYIPGDYDESTDKFTPDSDDFDAGYYTYEPVDGGLDFYASQVMQSPDGRHIMIGWMQDPSMSNLHDKNDFRIFGQMTVPRELSFRDGRLCQRPVRELDRYRTGSASYKGVRLESAGGRATADSISKTDDGRIAHDGISRTDDGRIALDGITGRIADLELSVRPDEENMDSSSLSYSSFSVRFAADTEHYVELSYDPGRSLLTIDRSHSGQPDYLTCKRTIKVRERSGMIDLRILLDRWSAEIFINDGEQTMSVTYFTDLSARNIEFGAEGSAIMDITGYSINI